MAASNVLISTNIKDWIEANYPVVVAPDKLADIEAQAVKWLAALSEADDPLRTALLVQDAITGEMGYVTREVSGGDPRVGNYAYHAYLEIVDPITKIGTGVIKELTDPSQIQKPV